MRGDWEPDGGALRDVYIHSTNLTDWQRVVDVVRLRWPSSYAEDSEPAAMPTSVAEIFRRSERLSPSWAVRPTPEIRINCFFFTPDEIEFDLDPSEINGQQEFDVVVDFIRAIAQVTGKPGIVCYENSPAATTFLRFDPSTGAFAVLR